MNRLGFLFCCLAGWVNRHQQDVIDYLQEEVRVLKEPHGGRRLRFSNSQRARLARKAKRIQFGKLKVANPIKHPSVLNSGKR